MLSRRAWLTLLAMPAACSIQPLPGLRRNPLPADTHFPAMREPSLGQHWTYRIFNIYNSEQIDTIREEITALHPRITLSRQSIRHGALPSETHTTWGQVQQDPLWEVVQTYEHPLPIWPQTLAPGTSTHIHTTYRPGTASFAQWIDVQSSITAAERVTVNAGTFDTLRLEKIIRLNHQDSSRTNYLRTDTLWLAPAIGRWVARETNGEYWVSSRRPHLFREDHLRWELDNWG